MTLNASLTAPSTCKMPLNILVLVLQDIVMLAMTFHGLVSN